MKRTANEKMQVFTLGDVAEILSVPISRIKNWTIGRPYRVVPSLVTGRGKGRRNLYTLEDVYLLALLTRLHDDGLSPDLISWLPKLANEKRVRAALVSAEMKFFIVRAGGGEEPELLFNSVLRRQDLASTKMSGGTYQLNLQMLRAEVNRKIAQLERRK